MRSTQSPVSQSSRSGSTRSSGFSLFFLRGVAPPEVRTEGIDRGVAPFVASSSSG